MRVNVEAGAQKKERRAVPRRRRDTGAAPLNAMDLLMLWAHSVMRWDACCFICCGRCSFFP